MRACGVLVAVVGLLVGADKATDKEKRVKEELKKLEGVRGLQSAEQDGTESKYHFRGGSSTVPDHPGQPAH
jgi:hypothetical protein